eukprot:CAMPEP_0117422388 /NCGR_PEP_ID=MMETSP0758-20121206/3239_1 /TAXON_ID=63605 /ORGANISM="Percolomonas cosmopolitus, Strain AE-1 (ATCC 50343)" /LENGTH=1837 /DNA_ID=CAMNT_0005204981 /DNA_START=326 /DNA_END=5836 /DNA_ORIENTATION=+
MPYQNQPLGRSIVPQQQNNNLNQSIPNQNQQRTMLSQTQQQPSGRSIVPQQRQQEGRLNQSYQQSQINQAQQQQQANIGGRTIVPVNQQEAKEEKKEEKPVKKPTPYDDLNNTNPETYLDNHYRDATKPKDEDNSFKASIIRFYRSEFIFAACMHNFNKYDRIKREAIQKVWKEEHNDLMMTVKDPNNNDVPFKLREKYYKLQEIEVKYLSESMGKIRDIQGIKLYYNAYFEMQKIQIDIISKIMNRSNATLDRYIEWIEILLEMKRKQPCPLSEYGESYMKELILYIVYALISMADPMTIIKNGHEHRFTNRVRILSIVMDLMVEHKAFDYMLPAFNLTPQDIVYGKFMQKAFEVYESGRVNEKHFFDLLHQCPFHDIQAEREEEEEATLLAFQDQETKEQSAYTIPWSVIKTSIMDVCIHQIDMFANNEGKRKLIMWCLKVIFTVTKHYPEHLMSIYKRLVSLPWPITKLLELVIPCADWQHLNDNESYKVIRDLLKLYEENFSELPSSKKTQIHFDYVNNYMCRNIGMIRAVYEQDDALAEYHQRATFPVLNCFKAIALGYATRHDWIEKNERIEPSNVFQECIHILLELAYKSGSNDKGQLQNLLDLRLESIQIILSLASFAPSMAIPIILEELLVLVPFLLANQPNICSAVVEKLVKKLPFDQMELTNESIALLKKLYQESQPLVINTMASTMLTHLKWKNQSSSMKLQSIQLFLKHTPIQDLCKLLCSKNGEALLDIDDENATQFIKTSMDEFNALSQHAQLLSLIQFAIGLSLANAKLSTNRVTLSQQELLFFDDQPERNEYDEKLQYWRSIANDMNYAHIAQYMPSEMAGFVRTLINQFISILSNFQLDDIGEELHTLKSLYSLIIKKDDVILNSMLDTLASPSLKSTIQDIYLHIILYDSIEENILNRLAYKLLSQNLSMTPFAEKLKSYHKVNRENIHKWYTQGYFWLAYLGMLALEHQIPPLEHSGSYSSSHSVISLEGDCCLWVAIHTAINALNGYDEQKTLLSLLYFQLFFNKLYECISLYGNSIFPEYQERQYLKIIHQAQDYFASRNESISSVFVCMDFSNPSTFFQHGDPLFKKLLETSPYATLTKEEIVDVEEEKQEESIYAPLITLPKHTECEIVNDAPQRAPMNPSFISLSKDQLVEQRQKNQQEIKSLQASVNDFLGQRDALKIAMDLDASQGMETSPGYTQKYNEIMQQLEQRQQQLLHCQQEETQLNSLLEQRQQKPIDQTTKKHLIKKKISPQLSIAHYKALLVEEEHDRILPQPLTVPFSILQHDIQMVQRVENLSNSILIGGQQDLGALIIKEFDDHRAVYKQWVELDEDLFLVLQTAVEERKETKLVEIFSPYLQRPFKLQVSPKTSHFSEAMWKKLELYDPSLVRIQQQLHQHFMAFAIYTNVLSTITQRQLMKRSTSPAGERCYFTLLEFLLNCPKLTLLQPIMGSLYQHIGQLGKLVMSNNPKYQRQILKVLLSVKVTDEDMLDDRSELFESFNPSALLSVDITKFREQLEKRRQSQHDFGMDVTNEEEPSPPHFIAYLKLLIDFTRMKSSLPSRHLDSLTSHLGMDAYFIALAELYEMGERFVEKEHVRLMFDVLRLTLPHDHYKDTIGKPFARHCIEIAFPQEIHKIVRLLFSFAEHDQLNMDFSDILIYSDSVMNQISSDQAKNLIDVVSSFNNLPDRMLIGSIRYIEALVLKTQLKDFLISYQVTEGSMDDLLRFYSQTLEQTDHSNLSSEAFMVIVKSLKNMMMELPMLSNMMWSMYCDVLYPRAKALGVEYTQALSSIMQTLNWSHSTFHIWNLELIQHMIEKVFEDPYAIGAMIKTFDWSW